MAKLLLIEPDRLLAETYRQLLGDIGHEVVPCAGAQAAIAAADEQRPDGVIMELQLIEHSGIEFLYELRSYKEWQQIPVIVHSQIPAGEFSNSWRLLRDGLGVVEYLYKPLTSLVQLRRAVERHVVTL